MIRLRTEINTQHYPKPPAEVQPTHHNSHPEIATHNTEKSATIFSIPEFGHQQQTPQTNGKATIYPPPRIDHGIPASKPATSSRKPTQQVTQTEATP